MNKLSDKTGLEHVLYEDVCMYVYILHISYFAVYILHISYFAVNKTSVKSDVENI